MTQPDPEEFEALWRQQFARLRRLLVACGRASHHDAEDAVQEAFAALCIRWPEVQDRPAYLYRAACNAAIKLAGRRHGDVARVLRVAARWIGRDLDDVHHGLHADVAREILAVLTPQQREVAMHGYDGLSDDEVADVLGVAPATVRAHRRDARERLQANGIDSGLPDAIRRSRARSLGYGVDPELPTAVTPLAADEVRTRRHESPLWAACTEARRALADVARRTGQLAVIVDADGVVLWRDGDRHMLALADGLSFTEAATWGEAQVGTNALGIVLATGRRAQVRGDQHLKVDQASLQCAAAPVRRPGDRQLLGALNLTTEAQGARPGFLKEVTTRARQVEQQLEPA